MVNWRSKEIARIYALHDLMFYAYISKKYIFANKYVDSKIVMIFKMIASDYHRRNNYYRVDIIIIFTVKN